MREPLERMLVAQLVGLTVEMHEHVVAANGDQDVLAAAAYRENRRAVVLDMQVHWNDMLAQVQPVAVACARQLDVVVGVVQFEGVVHCYPSPDPSRRGRGTKQNTQRTN